MAGKLEGKVAVVTGAGSEVGIGKEVAKGMATEGAKVVVNDVGKDPDGTMGADRVVKEIKDAKGTAVANYDSVASMKGGASIIKAAIDNFGRIDILVNTAGNFLTAPTVDMTEAQWDSILAVHLKGLFACSQAAVKEMIKQKSGGRIINFTSIAAYTPMMGPGPAAAYCTAKAGVLGFTKMLSMEMKQHGITVNVISPAASTMLFPGPDGRPIVGAGRGPEHVAVMVVYLATDEAKVVTGQIIMASAGDVTVFAPPMGTPGAHQYYQKEGKWTIDELTEVVPGMVALANVASTMSGPGPGGMGPGPGGPGPGGPGPR
jgi:NAD(P)-dependent dehydrogenase (short-subunit alcohol dehydrogenase family)